MKEAGRQLVTLEEFKKLDPFRQGYVSYMQAELPGSELKRHQDNPYAPGSAKYHNFGRGQTAAVLEVQDYDD